MTEWLRYKMLTNVYLETNEPSQMLMTIFDQKMLYKLVTN